MLDITKIYDVQKRFFKTLEREVVAQGGTIEMVIDRLGKESVQPSIKQLATALINNAKGLTIKSLAQQIEAGNYGRLDGFAEKPKQIEGQRFHKETNETELDNPGRALKIQKIYELYADNMATLSELLQCGINKPKSQLKYPIHIVWKVGDQFWFARLSRSQSQRILDIDKIREDTTIGGTYRVLIRE